MIARHQQRLVIATLIYPLTVVTSELLISTFSPHGTFGSIAYSQSENTMLMQILSATGLSGVTLLLCWLPASIAIAWMQRRKIKSAMFLLMPVLLAIMIVIGYGWNRLNSPLQGSKVKVVLLVDDAQLKYFGKTDEQNVSRVLSAYVNQITDAAAQGAQLVVLPEKTLSIAPSQVDAIQHRFQQLVDKTGISLIVGINLLENPKVNLAWLFSPKSATPGAYIKQHLVPGWEANYITGESPLIEALYGTPIGVIICKDLDFPMDIRRYGYAPGTPALLVVPAWDFGADAWLHSRMAMMRAIENGTSMLRVAHEGLLSAVDAHGVLQAESESNATEPVRLTFNMVFSWVPTVYKTYGDVFGWSIFVLYLIFLLRLLLGMIMTPRAIQTESDAFSNVI